MLNTATTRLSSKCKKKYRVAVLTSLFSFVLLPHTSFAEDVIKNNNVKKVVTNTTTKNNNTELANEKFEDVPIESIQNFIDAFQIVKQNYVAPTTDTELFENAMHGLVEKLDAYSYYLDAEQFKQLVEFTEGQVAQPAFSLKYHIQYKNWQLEHVKKKSNAYKQGLRDGMMVDRINGVNIQTLDQRTVNNLLSGTLGSMVTVRIKTQKNNKNFDIIRDEKLDYDVQSDIQQHILIIRIKAFQQNTVFQVEQILKRHQNQNILGIIFDIRDNPGGLLSAAVDLADLFLEQGLIVSTQSRTEPTQRFQALPGRQVIHSPIAILQNRYSASAAEVFSAALKQHKRAVVYGETSYGKGAIQKIFPLNEGALQLTVAHYITPNGTMIEGKGVESDETIEMANLTEQQIWNQAINIFNHYLNTNKKR